MAMFRNHYTCPECGESWTDEWSAMCDDDCPHCGHRHVSPHESEDIDDPNEPSIDGTDGGDPAPDGQSAAPRKGPKRPARNPLTQIWI